MDSVAIAARRLKRAAGPARYRFGFGAKGHPELEGRDADEPIESSRDTHVERNGEAA
jgi:hypothetical protein